MTVLCDVCQLACEVAGGGQMRSGLRQLALLLQTHLTGAIQQTALRTWMQKTRPGSVQTEAAEAQRPPRRYLGDGRGARGTGRPSFSTQPRCSCLPGCVCWGRCWLQGCTVDSTAVDSRQWPRSFDGMMRAGLPEQRSTAGAVRSTELLYGRKYADGESRNQTRDSGKQSRRKVKGMLQ